MNVKGLLKRIHHVEQIHDPVIPTFVWKIRDGCYEVHGERMDEAQFNAWSQRQQLGAVHVLVWVHTVDYEELAKHRAI
jgi:hypothetical protein